jgi:hypothetical protein
VDQLLLKSKYLPKLPQILRDVISRHNDLDSSELANLLFNAIQLANNLVRRDESLLKALASLIITNERLNQVVFKSFFEANEKNKGKGNYIHKIWVF